MHRRVICALALLMAGALAQPAFTQSKQPPAPSEWGQFEQLGIQPRGGLSPDGKWLVYAINRSSRNNELRVRNIASGAEKTVAFGSLPSFSADSKWIAYAIGYSEAQEERLRTQRKPIQRKLGLLKLDGASEPATVDGIESFSFDPGGAFIVMRRYAPERRDAPPAAAGSAAPAAAAPPSADDQPPAGVTVIVREMQTGRDTTFGNISEYAWQSVSDAGRLKPASTVVSQTLLALAISAEDKTGNGVHLYDAATGSHRALDSASAIYTGLAWRRDADDLIVLRAQTDEKREGSTHVALAWTGLASGAPKLHTLDPSKGSTVAAGTRTVSFRRPSWSEDGRLVFIGVAPWEEKLVTEKPSSPGETPAPPADSAEETATVDIWHAKDIEVMPRQKLSARTDRQRSMLAAWHLNDGKLVQLGKDAREQVTPLPRQPVAFASSWPAYAMERTIGRTAADISLVDLTTGARTKVADRIDDRYLQASPGGRYLLYLHTDHYWTVDTSTRAVANITKGAPTSFVDRESDFTVRQKPPFGVAGWTKNDESVVIYDKFDIWQVAADGTKATRLTEGAAGQVRHRYVRLNPEEEFIDIDKPLTVSLFGTWSKRSGYGRLIARGTQMERLLFDDKAIGGLGKARDADVYAYTMQAFDDSPDVFVGGAELKGARQITTTNPFISKYAWGRAEVVEFTSDRGERLQGALHYRRATRPGRSIR